MDSLCFSFGIGIIRSSVRREIFVVPAGVSFVKKGAGHYLVTVTLPVVTTVFLGVVCGLMSDL